MIILNLGVFEHVVNVRETFRDTRIKLLSAGVAFSVIKINNFIDKNNIYDKMIITYDFLRKLIIIKWSEYN